MPSQLIIIRFEDEKKGKSPVAIIAIIAGAVVLIGAGAFIVLRKKK